ncbi:MAG: primosomal protein N' [Candidatus Abyssobacteria bacterium SURF_17]|uniref:Replication restart protein PriA n=1 Tax=Candidatus Abyssobacteria bacterium SURF_17 TaxID=2093361 RepID=A0A419F860_9BACT|nr:MAG: primosomal protein N' [Candidatus Abyssubacteria bacterium SURF_17]
MGLMFAGPFDLWPGKADMSNQLFAQVVFNLPFDHSYTYSVSEDLEEHVKPGVRVAVHLRKHLATGYVVSVGPEAPDKDIKPICDVLDSEPLFDSKLLSLTRWIAHYYLCSWGQTLDCALPPSVRLAARTHISLVSQPASKLNKILSGLRASAPRQYDILKHIIENKKLTIAQLEKKLGSEGLYGSIAALEKRGVIAREAVIRRQAGAKQLSAVRIVAGTDVGTAVSDLASSSPKQASALKMICERGEMLTSEITRATDTSYDAIHRLVKKGYVELFSKEVLRSYQQHFTEDAAFLTHTLTGEQETALALVRASLEREEFQTILLEGITGSGKTEVYLQAIDLVVKQGKGAIVLVPEISLTPQTVARFRARFGDSVAVLHSRLSPGERYDEWRQIRAGLYNIVIGARSAIFAPVRKLGLIVVDEEHEASYKQGETPRYQARDVAIVRARDANAVVLLGSATPSLETYSNVEQGKYGRATLTARVQSQPLPKIHLIDLRHSKKGQTVETILSDELCFKIDEKLSRGEQVIIFLNRRGYTPFFLCPKCGVSVGCAHCSVALTYHASENRMKCHYCNSTQPVPEQCPHCGHPKLAKLGTGTERVQEELENMFQKARIQRMDADTTATKWAHEKILNSFEKGDIDILVGTQMLAKGLDFPRVTLVGVVLADVALNFPDFRSAERTFQLLMQVAGRSGRSHLGGEVIIQTYNPAHYAVQAAKRHDYTGFYREEMKLRRQLSFPPYRHLLNVLVDSPSQKQALQTIRRLAEIPRGMQQQGGARGLTVMGPSAAPHAKIKGRYRFRVLLLASNTGLLRSLGRDIMEAHRKLRSAHTRLTVDMDALSMM